MAEPAPAVRPRPLLWLYVLIAVTLISVGVAAGNLFFSGVRPLAIPYRLQLLTCDLTYNKPDAPLRIGDYTACMADQARLRSSVLLAGAVVVLVGAVLLTFVVPLVDRRRLRRFAGHNHPAAQARFDVLCARHGLSGPRAPRLLVVGPRVRHAFTTAVPGRRPTIVIPARLALRVDAEFDAIVSHEIAHVLARDVTWVSVVRGPLWLFIPIVAVAGLPEFTATEFTAPGLTMRPLTTLIESALLVAAVAVLATALLRLRELDADRYAARTGGAPALRALFTRAQSAPEGWQGWAAWLLTGRRHLVARHPDPDVRARALDQDERDFEGGFAQALAVGFVAMMAMGTVSSVLPALSLRWGSWQGMAGSAVAGAGALCILTPSLARRARLRADRPQWWRPLAGIVLGIGLGAFLSPVVSTTGQIPFPSLDGSVSLTLRLGFVAAVAILAAGTVAVAIGLAVASAGRPLAGRLGQLAVFLTAVAALWPVTSAAVLLQLHPFDDLRYWYGYVAVHQVWPMLGLGLFVVCLLAVIRTAGPRTGRERWMPWWLAGIAAAIGGVAGVVTTATATAVTTNERLRLQQQRWWICVAAGIVVLVVLVLTRRDRHAWPRAVVAATATTLVACAVQYLFSLVTGRPANLLAVEYHFGVAPVWLFYLVLVTAPVLAVRTVRAVPAPAGLAVTPAPVTPAPVAPAVRTAPVLAGAAAVTAVLAAVFVLVGVPGGFASDGVPIAAPSAGPTGAPTAEPTATPVPGADRRVLNTAQAQAVANAGARLLREPWRVEKVTSSGASFNPADVSPEICRPLATDRYLSVGFERMRSHATAQFGTTTGGSTRTSMDLTIDVYSYDVPVAQTLIDVAEQSRVACPRFTVNDGQLAVDLVVRSAPAPSFGQQNWRYDTQLTAKLGPSTVTGANAFVLVGVGNTVITAYFAALLEPIDEKLLSDVLNASVHTLLTVA